MTEYQYYISAQNRVGLSPPYKVKDTTKGVIMPGPPVQLQIQESTGSKLKLIWKAPHQKGGGNIVSYRIYLNTKENLVKELFASALSIDSTGFYVQKLTKLQAEVHYTLYLSAVNAAGETEQEDWASISAQTAHAEIPSKPIMDKITRGDSASKCTLFFEEPEDLGGLGQPIYFVTRTEHETEKTIPPQSHRHDLQSNLHRKVLDYDDEVTFTTTDLMFTDSNLLANTNYSYTVYAVNEEGVGDASSVIWILTLDATPPSEPANFSANALDGQSIKLSWSAPLDWGGIPPEEISYRLFRWNEEIAQLDPLVYEFLDDGLWSETGYGIIM